MQLTGPAVIVYTIRGIRVLLDFEKYCSGADGMDCACLHVDQIAGMEIDPVEQLLHASFTDRSFNFWLCYPRLQPKTNLRARHRLQHIPALRFAAWFAHSGSSFIVRMDLYGKLFQGKKKLEKQRET